MALPNTLVLVGAGVCSLAFCIFLFYFGTYSYQNLSLKSLNTDIAVGPLSGSVILTVLCTWATLLLATLLTLFIRRFFPTSPKKKVEGHILQVRRLLSWQLPPRAFFAAWCGGLSLAEAAGIVAWLGLNACWLVLGLKREFKGVNAWEGQLNGAAKVFGQMTAPNLMLLFLPIPHTNVITWITGTSRNRLIRFHRWLGHGTLWVVTIHATLYLAYWWLTDTFWTNFSAWRDTGGVNNLAGVLAFFCALVLWATSLTYVRRHFYEFFYRCHIFLFLGFFLLSCAHYSSCWQYFAPGLLLYAADLALRAGQMSNITTVTAAAVDEDSGVATLLLPADKALKHSALTEVWLLLPRLSRWQWHPFSVASGGGRVLKLHVKKYGRFTKGLLAVLRQRQPLAVRLSGPMGNEVAADCQLTPPATWQEYEVVVMVCGGVGVTGMLSVLRAMAAQRAAGARSGVQAAGSLPRRVLCIWTARHMGEFLALDAPLLLASAAQDGWLSFQLHLTGAPSLTTSAPPIRGDISKVSIKACSSRSLPQSSAGDLLARAPPAPVRIPGASAYFWNLLRPAQPLSLGSFHLAAVFVLTYFGAFCGVLLGSSYLEQPAVELWKGGMLTCILMSAVALGLPFLVVIFPVHAFRYWMAARSMTAGVLAAQQQVAVPYADQALLQEQSCAVVKDSITLPGEGIAITARPGRPDISAALRTAAAESGATTIGVYAGGPAGLMKTVHLAVCQLNSESGGAHYELHNESVEL